MLVGTLLVWVFKLLRGFLIDIVLIEVKLIIFDSFVSKFIISITSTEINQLLDCFVKLFRFCLLQQKTRSH